MQATTYKSLVQSTLDQTRIYNHGCLVGDAAAEELEALGVRATPAIRRAIQALSHTHSRDATTPQDVRSRHPGIERLFSILLKLTPRDGMAELAVFLRGLPDAMLATAIQALNGAWRKPHPVPLPILRLVRETTHNLASFAGEDAAWFMRNHWRR